MLSPPPPPPIVTPIQYEKFCDIYDLYSGFGRFDKNDTDDTFELQKNEVKQWAVDSKMIHGADASWNRLFTFFLAANVEIEVEKEEPANDLAQANTKTMATLAPHDLAHQDDDNDDTSLVRFEFLLFLVMCSHARYYSQSSNDLVSAVDKCFRTHVGSMTLRGKYEHLPQMDPDEIHPVVHRPNDFRYSCLYRIQVGRVLHENNKFLMGVYIYYSKTTGRKNELSIANWFDMIKDVQIIDQDSSERDVLLCFCYSRMRVRDEMLDRHRVTVLTYCDFLESLVRIAMVKSFDIYALVVDGQVDMANLTSNQPMAMKWFDCGFKPECEAVNRLAAKSKAKWRAEDAGDRLDILIRGMKYMFETRMDFHINTKFGRVTSKQVKVLESRDLKRGRQSKAPKTTKLQRFDPDTGKAMFPQCETGHVQGITMSDKSASALGNVFSKKRTEHQKVKLQVGGVGGVSGGGFQSKLLSKLAKRKK